MLGKLKEEVLNANKKLQAENLVALTWGNVSGRDPESGLIVIKASGVEYADMTTDDLVVVDRNGMKIEGSKVPSTDLETHLVLYREFQNVNGIVHTHSEYAAAWAQGAEGIPCFGTTHADYFPGEIPVTREMRKEEIINHYEENTGHVIVERFKDLNPDIMRAVLVRCHGPFVWGISPTDAIHISIVLENVAKMNLFTRLLLGNNKSLVNEELLKKHYNRKFGEDAYYGQQSEV